MQACCAQVMTQAGGDVKEEVWRACIVLLTNTPELHGYAARALYRALAERLPGAQLSLVATATWYIGARTLSPMQTLHTAHKPFASPKRQFASSTDAPVASDWSA
jgi:hypothetical protein